MAQKRNSEATTTLLRVPWTVADALNAIGKRGESYAQIIQKLLNAYKKGE